MLFIHRQANLLSSLTKLFKKVIIMAMRTIPVQMWGVFVCVLSFLHCAQSAAEQHWTEVRSPHFRVLTNDSSRDGRNVANQFEQMRHVLSLRFRSGRIDASAPLTIFAVDNGNTFRDLEPQSWKRSSGNLSGEFLTGWEKQFAIVRLDEPEDFAQSTVFHEYTHSVLHANVRWLPVWLDEGMAEFYAYTRIQTNKIYVGAPSIRMWTVQNHPLLPVSQMLDINRGSTYFQKDQAKTQLFYAESWAMVHYMIFGNGMELGAKFNKFLGLLQDKRSQQKAFEETFGDPNRFDSEFSKYLMHPALVASALPPDKGIDPKTFADRRLTEAEANYEIGCLHMGSRNPVAGRASIEKAVSLDPKLAAPHEELGYLAYDTGKDEEAVEEWRKAQTLDPKTYRSLFALTMAGKPFAQQSAQELMTTQASLRHVTELAPTFAPAFAELALLEWRLGTMQQAYKDAREAETLEPARAGYFLLTGYILLHGNQVAMAGDYARYVATRWDGSDHNEAVDLWEAVPSAMRGEGPSLAYDKPADSQIVRGKLTKVACSVEADNKTRINVTFVPAQPVDAQPLQLTEAAEFSSGFSDTLWWGEDHFSVCHHLAGHTALVGYKPQGATTGEFSVLEVRDDLPGHP